MCFAQVECILMLMPFYSFRCCLMNFKMTKRLYAFCADTYREVDN